MLGEMSFQTNYVSKEECENIIQYYKENEDKAVRSVVGYPPHTKIDLKRKISKTLRIDDKEHPLLKSTIEKISTLTMHANEFIFLFNVDWSKTKFYIFEYDGEEKGFKTKQANVNWISNNYQNKIITTTVLSDPTDYEGGDIQLYIGKGEINDIPTPEEFRSQGITFSYPAFRFNEILPVLSGKKYHLEVQFQGPYWR
jgi:hypothetical protein